MSEKGRCIVKDGTKNMAVTAVMTAVICMLAPLSIPIGPVPVSLATLAILFTVYILGMKRAVAAVMLYLLIGLAGVPVFSGFSAGPAKLLGPTGGYLIGYIPMAAIAGLVTDRFYKNRIISILGMAAATAVLYAVGTVWLACSAGMSLEAALAAGVIPFIPLDLVKTVAAALIGPLLKTRLETAGLTSLSLSDNRRNS
ncbi:MAG: biotin transporter BioY [Lachnospiraceae bacterium]|nr:biotin transporter BioY [Lachnospiraceae bacterium]